MAEEETAPVDPVVAIQNALSELDLTSLCTGFVVVAEYLEEDGSNSMCVIHTDMAPWHVDGLMTYAKDHARIEAFSFASVDDDDYDE